MDQRMKNDLDNHITGHYGEDQFKNEIDLESGGFGRGEMRHNEESDDKNEPTIADFKKAIENVSKSWNEMLQNAIKEDRTIADNPIVSMLQPNGEMVSFANSLQKLFELNW